MGRSERGEMGNKIRDWEMKKDMIVERVKHDPENTSVGRSCG